MIQVIRYLKGYLAIKVFGFSPERFMNLCSNHNIFLWDIENHGDYYTMKISLKGFYRLRGISRKTGTRVVITKRYGLPFLSLRMWRRRIFVCGLLGSLIFWIWMSGFIWAIEVEGNYYVTTDVFQDFLVSSGFEAGMKKSDVEIEALEKAIRNEFDIVTWTSARIDGTRLLIQVKENDLIQADESKPELPDGEGVDLVAGKEGEIVSIVTRSGTPKVTAGTLVNEGDVLVEGGVPIMNEDGTVRYYDYCRADADIMLKCTYLLKEELKEQYEQKQYTGNEKKSLFIMFGTKKVKLPTIGKGYETYDVIEEKKQLKLFENYYLPVYIGSDLVREYVVEEKIYSQNEVKKLFEEKIQKFIETLQEKGVQIIEKNVTINKVSGVWKMKVDFQAIEKTGTERKTQLVQVEEEPQQEGEIQE
ncbi:MAG: sporulation protein YqfD [Lachnospiraceae bacterium]|nr:sporulation protein YqfD [Lachnospiraceae bacterium]MDE6183997.1 sporulation protein YqfD [Lachnospiraceae bacterium]